MNWKIYSNQQLKVGNYSGGDELKCYFFYIKTTPNCAVCFHPNWLKAGAINTGAFFVSVVVRIRNSSLTHLGRIHIKKLRKVMNEFSIFPRGKPIKHFIIAFFLYTLLSQSDKFLLSKCVIQNIFYDYPDWFPIWQ